MSFSFETPVAALSEHQERIKLLSQNIANINTPGFKGNRMTFVETLGSVSGVTQFEFSQGDIKSTGKVTDLAIQGDSFFVLNNGEDNMYTRTGSFDVNEKGELVNVDGLKVQGWMRDISTANPTLSEKLGNIVIDPNLSMPAKATQNAWLSGNLNSGLETTTEVWKSDSALSANDVILQSGSQITGTTTIDATNNEFGVSFDGAVPETVTLNQDTYDDLDELVEELNAQFNTNVKLSGKVEAFNSNGYLQIRNTSGDEGSTMTLSAGTNDFLNSVGISPGDATFEYASETTELNKMLQVTSDLQDGDKIVISGSKANGESISAEYTYSSGDTLQSLLSTINAEFDGSGKAEISNGEIVLIDDEAGDSATRISLATADSNAGQISLPIFTNTEEGYTASVNSSIEVYDSTGASHNINIKFEKSDTTGEWIWTASGTNNETITTGGSGKVTFDQNGNLRTFTYDGNANGMKINPGNGAQTLKVQLHTESSENANGLTQYNSVSSVKMNDQDGAAAGVIEGFNFEKDGSLIASFNNGKDEKIAQVALAEFSNPSGLQKIDGSNFITTPESGIASIGKADSQDSEIKAESLETSTVDLADQFTKLIEAQNSYQAAAKVVNTFEEVSAQATQLKR